VTHPHIDPEVRHVRLGTLRNMSGRQLCDLTDTVVVHVGDEPVAVLLPYGRLLAMQRDLHALRDELEVSGSGYLPPIQRPAGTR